MVLPSTNQQGLSSRNGELRNFKQKEKAECDSEFHVLNLQNFTFSIRQRQRQRREIGERRFALSGASSVCDFADWRSSWEGKTSLTNFSSLSDILQVFSSSEPTRSQSSEFHVLNLQMLKWWNRKWPPKWTSKPGEMWHWVWSINAKLARQLWCLLAWPFQHDQAHMYMQFWVWNSVRILCDILHYRHDLS